MPSAGAGRGAVVARGRKVRVVARASVLANTLEGKKGRGRSAMAGLVDGCQRSTGKLGMLPLPKAM